MDWRIRKRRSQSSMCRPAPAFRSSHRFSNISAYRKTSQPFLQSALDKFDSIKHSYSKDVYDFMSYYYLKKQMSTGEIRDMIYKDCVINIDPRYVRLWLQIAGIKSRGAHERYVLAIKKKRMNYERRVFDYKARAVREGYLWATGLKKLLKKKGSIIKLAKTIGCTEESVNKWKQLKGRVSPAFHEKLCKYFKCRSNKLFSIK